MMVQLREKNVVLYIRIVSFLPLRPHIIKRVAASDVIVIYQENWNRKQRCTLIFSIAGCIWQQAYAR